LAAPVLAVLASCGSAPEDPTQRAMARLRRLARPKTPPGPGDWLAQHKEPGQTYQQFRAQVKVPAGSLYSTLRIVPIGPLSAGQTSVLSVVQDFLPAFFGLPLELDPPVPLEEIPADAQRTLLPWDEHQLLTTYLLNKVLMSRRQPRDAAVLGITAIDLWPGEGWNFVFGQASLKERVGVWSMARNGDPDESDDMRKLCALRTTMTSTHETGHMFGIRHCIAYECGMNGSNHSDERDRQPLEFCPECQAKLWWTLGLDPLERSRALEAASRKHGFTVAADDFARQAGVLGS
jgi:archaemetzincin